MRIAHDYGLTENKYYNILKQYYNYILIYYT